MSVPINPGFGAVSRTGSRGPIKHVDAAERFVNPVTLTDESGSFVGTTSYPLVVTGSLGNVILSASDIQIGAVEIKDATTDTRVKVSLVGALIVSSSNDQALVPSANTSFAYSFYSSSVYESGSIVKTSSGILYGLSGYNSKGSAQFVQIHNSNVLPESSSKPIIPITVPASSNFSWDAGRFGIPMSGGITVLNSSDAPGFLSGSDDCWFNVTYK